MEAIDRLKGKAEDDLQGMFGTRRALHSRKRRRQFRLGGLDLDEEPGLAVLRYQEVHFALLLVADVEEVVFAEAEIRPQLDGL